MECVRKGKKVRVVGFWWVVGGVVSDEMGVKVGLFYIWVL